MSIQFAKHVGIRNLLKTTRRQFSLTHSRQPVKLILVHNGCQQDQLAEALSSRICDSIRRAHLNVMPCQRLIDSAQVPFTVVITERTLVDGVLQLQHQWPRISEEVHVSNLVDRLLQQTSGAAAVSA